MLVLSWWIYSRLICRIEKQVPTWMSSGYNNKHIYHFQNIYALSQNNKHQVTPKMIYEGKWKKNTYIELKMNDLTKKFHLNQWVICWYHCLIKIHTITVSKILFWDREHGALIRDALSSREKKCWGLSATWDRKTLLKKVVYLINTLGSGQWWHRNLSMSKPSRPPASVIHTDTLIICFTFGVKCCQN